MILGLLLPCLCLLGRTLSWEDLRQSRPLEDLHLADGETRFVQLSRYFQGKGLVFQLQNGKGAFSFEVVPALAMIKKVTLNYDISKVVSVHEPPSNNYSTFVLLTQDQYIINCRVTMQGQEILVAVHQQHWILSDRDCTDIVHYKGSTFILQCQQYYSPYNDDPISVDLKQDSWASPVSSYSSLQPIPTKKHYSLRVIDTLVYRHQILDNQDRNDRLDIFQVGNSEQVQTLQSIYLQDYFPKGGADTPTIRIADLQCYNRTLVFVLDKTFGLISTSVRFEEFFDITLSVVNTRFVTDSNIEFKEILLLKDQEGKVDQLAVVANLFLEFYWVDLEGRLELVERVLTAEQDMQVEQVMLGAQKVFLLLRGQSKALLKAIDTQERRVQEQMLLDSRARLYTMPFTYNTHLGSSSSRFCFLQVSGQEKSFLEYQPAQLVIMGDRLLESREEYENLVYTVYSQWDEEHKIKGAIKVYPVNEYEDRVQHDRSRIVSMEQSEQTIQLDQYLLGQNLHYLLGEQQQDNVLALPIKSLLKGHQQWTIECPQSRDHSFQETIRTDEDTLISLQQDLSLSIVITTYDLKQTGHPRVEQQVVSISGRVDTLCSAQNQIRLFSKVGADQQQCVLYLLFQQNKQWQVQEQVLTRQQVSRVPENNTLNFQCGLDLHSPSLIDTSEGYSAALVRQNALLVKKGADLQLVRIYLSSQGIPAYQVMYTLETGQPDYQLQVSIHPLFRRYFVLIISRQENTVQQWLLKDLSRMQFMRRLPLFDYQVAAIPARIVQNSLVLPITYHSTLYWMFFSLEQPSEKVITYIHFSPSIRVPQQALPYSSLLFLKEDRECTLVRLSTKQLVVSLDGPPLQGHYDLTHRSSIQSRIRNDSALELQGIVPLQVMAYLNQSVQSSDQVAFNLSLDCSRLAIRLLSFQSNLNYIKDPLSDDYQVEIVDRQMPLPFRLKGMVESTTLLNIDQQYSFLLLDHLSLSFSGHPLQPLLPEDQALDIGESMVVLRVQPQRIEVLSVPRVTSHSPYPVKSLSLSFLTYLSPGPLSCTRIHKDLSHAEYLYLQCLSPKGTLLFRMQVSSKYNYNLFRQISQVQLPVLVDQMLSLRVVDPESLIVVLHARDSRSALPDQELLVLSLNQTAHEYGGQFLFYSTDLLTNINGLSLDQPTLSLLDFQIASSLPILHLFLMTPSALYLVTLHTTLPLSLEYSSSPLSSPVSLSLHHQRLVVRTLNSTSLLSVSYPGQEIRLSLNSSLSQAYYLDNLRLASSSEQFFLGVAQNRSGQHVLQVTILDGPLLGVDQMLSFSSPVLAISALEQDRVALLLQDGQVVQLALRQQRLLSLDRSTTNDQMKQRVLLVVSNNYFNQTYSLELMVNLDQHTLEHYLFYGLIIAPQTLALVFLLAFYLQRKASSGQSPDLPLL